MAETDSAHSLSAAQGPLFPPLSVISETGDCVSLLGRSSGGDSDATFPGVAPDSSRDSGFGTPGAGRGSGGEGEDHGAKEEEGQDEFQRLNDSCALHVFSFLAVPIHRAACAQVSKRWFWLEKRSRKLVRHLDLSCPSRVLEGMPPHSFPYLTALDVDCAAYQLAQDPQDLEEQQAIESWHLRQLLADRPWESLGILNSTFLLHSSAPSPSATTLRPPLKTLSGFGGRSGYMQTNNPLAHQTSGGIGIEPPYSSTLSPGVSEAPRPNGAVPGVYRRSPSDLGAATGGVNVALIRGKAGSGSFRGTPPKGVKGTKGGGGYGGGYTGGASAAASASPFGMCAETLTSLELAAEPWDSPELAAPSISSHVFFHELSACSRIERLTISQTVRGSSRFMEHALEAMGSLRFVDFGKLRVCLPGEGQGADEVYRGATDGMLAALGRGCPRLEEAHIGPGASLAGVGPLVRGCQELRLLSDVGEPTLDLAQVPCMWANNETLEELGAANVSLVSLGISCCGDVTDAGLLALADARPALRHLALTTAPNQLSFEGVSKALESLTSLETLFLGFCEEVEGHGFSSFVCALSEYCPHLRSLAIGVCLSRDQIVVTILLQSCMYLTSLYLFDPCAESHEEEEAELQELAKELSNTPVIIVGHVQRKA